MFGYLAKGRSVLAPAAAQDDRRFPRQGARARARGRRGGRVIGYTSKRCDAYWLTAAASSHGLCIFSAVSPLLCLPSSGNADCVRRERRFNLVSQRARGERGDRGSAIGVGRGESAGARGSARGDRARRTRIGSGKGSGGTALRRVEEERSRRQRSAAKAASSLEFWATDRPLEARAGRFAAQNMMPPVSPSRCEIVALSCSMPHHSPV